MDKEKLIYSTQALIRHQTAWKIKFSSQPATEIIQTTSVLTAATLIYARRAGITAAAGTRPALFLFLVKSFQSFSFQLT